MTVMETDTTTSGTTCQGCTQPADLWVADTDTTAAPAQGWSLCVGCAAQVLVWQLVDCCTRAQAVARLRAEVTHAALTGTVDGRPR